jgi:hypothetical protein
VAFEQLFLRVGAYPVDPFRGVVIPGTVAFLPSANWSLVVNAVAIPTSVPDMSMPFNVIMISATLLSMAFSGFYRLATGVLVTHR